MGIGGLRRIATLLWAATAILCATMFAAPPAAAQAWSLGDPVAVCIRPAVPADRTAELLSRPTGFDCDPDQRKHGPGDFWVMSEPVDLRVDTDRSLRIRTASLWQERQTLYALHADRTVTRFVVPDRGAWRNVQLGALFEYRIPPGAAPVERLLWRIDGSANMRGILMGVRVTDSARSTQTGLTMAAIYAGFGGLCLGLLVYNIALWVALRHRFQLAYCMMVAALLLYAFSSSGTLGWAFHDLTNTGRIRINHLALALAAAAALFFARTFFEPRIFGAASRRIILAVALAVLAGGIVYAVVPASLIAIGDLVFSVAFLFLPLAVIPILWSAWRGRSSYLWLFAVAWAVPVAMAVARAIHNVGLLPWSFWLDNSTILAMALEALLSSLAIAYRIRLLSIERDVAIEQAVSTRVLAETDPLTGLLNRRAFLHYAIGRPGDQVLLLIDIDHFKRVNDTIGHDGGDEVLQAVARALASLMPPGALLARMGGEEFAILTHLSEAPEPDRVLDRLRQAPMPFDLRVTASVGACIGPLATDIDWKQLYRCADRALFSAKAEGRDRSARTVRLASVA